MPNGGNHCITSRNSFFDTIVFLMNSVAGNELEGNHRKLCIMWPTEFVYAVSWELLYT